jgi:hypothetical protein
MVLALAARSASLRVAPDIRVRSAWRTVPMYFDLLGTGSSRASYVHWAVERVPAWGIERDFVVFADIGGSG